MADAADLANKSIDEAINNALHRFNQAKQQKLGESKHCFGCGDDIPEERRALGFNLCIICAEESERKQALFPHAVF